MVAACPAWIWMQAFLLILNRMERTVVSAKLPSSAGPTISLSPSLTTPLFSVPPRTRPTSCTLNSSSTWNSAGSWLRRSCFSCEDCTGNTCRKLFSSSKWCPVTQDMWKIGTTLKTDMSDKIGDIINAQVNTYFPALKALAALCTSMLDCTIMCFRLFFSRRVCTMSWVVSSSCLLSQISCLVTTTNRGMCSATEKHTWSQVVWSECKKIRRKFFYSLVILHYIHTYYNDKNFKNKELLYYI